MSSEPSSRRSLGSVALTALAALLVWIVLLAPDRLSDLGPWAFVRIPLEGLVLTALVVVLPPRVRNVVAAVIGALLGLVMILRILDLGFHEAFDRPFNPVTDRGYADSAFGLLRDSIGATAAVVAVVTAGSLVLALLVLLPLATVRLGKIGAAHRAGVLRTVAVLGVAWAVCAAYGVRVSDDQPVAARSAATLAVDQIREVRAGVSDEAVFAEQARVDAFDDTPGDQLLTALRGKDVVFAFVESYGRVAVQDSSFSPGVSRVLASGTTQLQRAGFGARTGFLTSPTFGGLSWLAHSTLQSGLWVDNEQRYRDLMTSDRLTLSQAFAKAGWRTVGDVPSNTEDWPEGHTFYGYDRVYDADDVGYAGPKFSYASMPDQYTWAAFQRLELGRRDRPPLMAEIDLVSSHTPWAPLPRPVPWDQVGDGSVFDDQPAEGDSPDEVWRDPARVQTAYGRSIEYSIGTLVDFVRRYGDDNLVLVVLGDHQPATIVSGEDADHDVPISVIAHDPAVLKRITDWGWTTGLQPAPTAPVWPMDTFRDRFLNAYSPRPPTDG